MRGDCVLFHGDLDNLNCELQFYLSIYRDYRGGRNMARGVKRAHPVALLFTLMLLFWRDVYAQVSFNEITGFSLSPPYFNLAEGSRISATATCGQDETGRPRSDLYCKLVGGPTFGLPSQTIQVMSERHFRFHYLLFNF